MRGSAAADRAHVHFDIIQINEKNRSGLLPLLPLPLLQFFRFSLDPLTVLLQRSQLSFQRLQLFHQLLQLLRLSLLFSQLLRKFDGFVIELWSRRKQERRTVRIAILIVDPAGAAPPPAAESSTRVGGMTPFMMVLTFIEPQYESSDPSDRFEHRSWLLESERQWLATDNGKRQLETLETDSEGEDE